MTWLCFSEWFASCARIFNIQMIKALVRPGIRHTTFGFKNLQSVLPGKSKMALKNRFLGQIITIGRIFEIQTVSTQVR